MNNLRKKLNKEENKKSKVIESKFKRNWLLFCGKWLLK